MATFDRVKFEIDLLSMTDSELLQLENDLDDLRPFQPRDAVQYGMVIAELQRRTGGNQESMPTPDELDADEDKEVQAALAAAVAFYLHREKKGELRLDDESLPDHWLEVHREPGAWVFRVREDGR
jgi:hypothetical protein